MFIGGDGSTPRSNLLLPPKLVAVLPAFPFEALEISKYDPGPGVVSSIY
jgi:hypothetical protein